ncbi:MAG: hypothetical protein KDD37_06420 [Bdellovibrionales bacterium]|nr:hypothetical protein [Bdellovibrionales bacterium]
MKSVKFFIFILIGITFAAISFAGNTNFSKPSSFEEEVKSYSSILLRNINLLKESVIPLHLSNDEFKEIDGQFYALARRVETMRIKDEYEFAAHKEALDASYNDLVASVRTLKMLKSR